MKTEILDVEYITKDIALEQIKISKNKDVIDEYLDIISAINEGISVLNLITTSKVLNLKRKNNILKIK